MKGCYASDEILRRARGYDVLEKLFRSDVTIKSSIDSLVLTLFEYNKNHLVIESNDEKWTETFTDLFVRNNYNNKIYEQSYELEEFLRNALRLISIFGKAFYAIDYLNDSSKGQCKVERISLFPVETMTVNYRKGTIRGFTQQYSPKSTNYRVNKYKTDFSPEEIFFIEWIFDNDKGASPLLALQKNCETDYKFRDFSLKYFYANAHPEDKSFSIEKVRYTSFKKEMKKSVVAKLENIAKIGGIIQQKPMTDYYYAYYFARHRERVATIREYLVEQFNLQILSVISAKNGLTQPARLKIVDYLFSSDIEKLIKDHKNSKLSSEELVNILRKDMHS